MDKMTLGLRTQDFQEGLRETGTFGPKEAYFEKTLRIGKAAVLAMHMRGLLFIDDYTSLQFAAGQLGIGGSELPAILRELEEVDFIRVMRSGEEIRRVDIRVPEFRTGYEDLGSRWEDLKPSEIERAAVETLQSLVLLPRREVDLLQALGLESGEISILQDVMRDGQLLRVQTISGEKIAFTPLVVDENPTAYLKWASKFPSEVSEALKTLTEHQGLPISDPVIAANPSLEDAVATGVLMPVLIEGATVTQEFVFAPRGGLTSHERVILDKARAVVACVRYGQRFAAGRKILRPRAILERLREHKRFRRGHPDLRTQYNLLLEKLIGHPVDEGGGLWNFEIYDTDENMKALDIAIEMLEIGETPTAKIDLAAKKALLAQSSYLGPIPSRTRLARSIKGSPETQAEIIKQLSAIGRGMKV